MKCQISFIVLIALFCECKQSSPPVHRNEVNAIDTYLMELIEHQQIPGLAIVATRNDSVVYQRAFGVRNIETKEPMNPSYNFHWASVSKTFVGMAIMQLVEKGDINLDEKVTYYLPYFKQQDENYNAITVRQLLNHTSGIGDVVDYEWDKPQNDEGAPERYVRGLQNDTMVFVPGKDFAYSNIAYEILGVIIAKVSGVTFEDYMRQNILTPLEMNNSSFVYPEIPDSLRVNGHSWDGKTVLSPVYPYNRIHAPSSTLNSNILEMPHYAIANLHRGEYKGKRVLSDFSYDILWTNSVNLEGKEKVGISWILGEHKGMKTVGHSGGDIGFRSYLLLVPDRNISVAVVCNYDQVIAKNIALGALDILIDENPNLVKK